MNSLTFNQTSFIANTFFKNENYNGWEGIAHKLIKNGKCVVAGTKCIWQGGIGNFIQTSKPEDFVDCLLYEFNLTDFISSEYFIDSKKYELERLHQAKIAIDVQYNDILSLK